MMLPAPTYILQKAYMFMDTLKSRNRDNTVFFCRLRMSLTTIHVFARVSRRGGYAVGSVAEFFGKQEEYDMLHDEQRPWPPNTAGKMAPQVNSPIDAVSKSSTANFLSGSNCCFCGFTSYQQCSWGGVIRGIDVKMESVLQFSLLKVLAVFPCK